MIDINKNIKQTILNNSKKKPIYKKINIFDIIIKII